MNYHLHFRTKDDTDSKVSAYFEFVSRANKEII